MNPFIRFIKENVPEEERPIKLGIRLDKVVYDRYGRGKDSRYMRVFVGEHDVTQMAANLIGKKPSKARDTYGDIIVHLFTEEGRDFYDLERIWRDGVEVNPSEL